MIQADNRAEAIEDYESAREAEGTTGATIGLGVAGVIAGGGTAAVSCWAAPLTFVALGGTGWPCVFGLVGAVAGLGTTIVSLVERGQAVGDKNDALERWDSANAEVNGILNALEMTAP